MNGIEYIASILKLEGVELMPCYPSIPLVEEVAKVGIRPVAFGHERGGVPGRLGGVVYRGTNIIVGRGYTSRVQF